MNFYKQAKKDTNGNYDFYFIEKEGFVIEFVDSWANPLRIDKNGHGERYTHVDTSLYRYRHAKPCNLEDLPEVLQLLIRK